MNEYLPLSTLQWCEQKVRDLGLRDLDADRNPISYDRGSPHREVYLALRTAIQDHIRSGVLPHLRKTVHPTNATRWTPDPQIVRSFEETGGDGTVFQNDNVEEADNEEHTDTEAGEASDSDLFGSETE